MAVHTTATRSIVSDLNAFCLVFLLLHPGDSFLIICLFLTVNSKKQIGCPPTKKKGKKSPTDIFFHPCKAVSCLHLLLPVSMSPFLGVSSLPGVYLQHKDGALMMPQGCQYNQRVILFIYASCQKTKAYKLQLQRLQHELAPTPKLSFHRVTGTKMWTKALSTQSDIVFGWIPLCAGCLHLLTAVALKKKKKPLHSSPNDCGCWQISMHCGKMARKDQQPL